MEKSTRVKARVKAQALKEFMSTKDRVVVMGHKITDVDALGAGIGIYRAGKTLGKPVHIVINDPTTSIRPLMSGFMEIRIMSRPCLWTVIRPKNWWITIR